MAKKKKDIQVVETITPIEGIMANDHYRINGSGLFHWNTSLTEQEQLIILNWYEKLTPNEKQYIQHLRHEARLEEHGRHCGDEI